MRREADIVLAGLPRKLSLVEGRVNTLESSLAENTNLTRTVHADTRTIVAFVNDVDAVWRFCKLFRRVTFRLAKWTAAVSAAVAGVAAAAQAAGAFDVLAWARGLFR